MNKLKAKFKINVKKPQNNFFGKVQLKRMNSHHSQLADWGLEFVDFSDKKTILDIGCGGGKHLQKMSKLAKNSQFFGADYSQASIDMTAKLNKRDIADKKLQLTCCSVENLPYEECKFDLITAFETIYFWNIEKGFAEVFRTLKRGGSFVIINEAKSTVGMEDYIQTIGFEIYSVQQIENFLKKSGFDEIKICEHDNGKWIFVSCKKP